MRLLFAITVFCFCTVMWCALWLIRRIQSTRSIRTRPARRGRRWFTQEFFEAGDFRTPRALRLRQEIPSANRRHCLLLEGTAQHDLLPANLPQSINPAPFAVLPFAAPAARTEPIADPSFSVKKGTIIPISPPVSGRILKTVLGRSPNSPLPHRKPPLPARPHGVRRVDLSQYNRSFDNGPTYDTEVGDLSDPYTHSARGSGTQGPVVKSINRL